MNVWYRLQSLSYICRKLGSQKRPEHFHFVAEELGLKSRFILRIFSYLASIEAEESEHFEQLREPTAAVDGDCDQEEVDDQRQDDAQPDCKDPIDSEKSLSLLCGLFLVLNTSRSDGRAFRSGPILCLEVFAEARECSYLIEHILLKLHSAMSCGWQSGRY